MRMRIETVREYIDENSFGAYVTFEFDVDKVSNECFNKYSCISVEDFLNKYGRRSSHILDEYIVVNTEESYPSNDKGKTIRLTLQKKSEYIGTLKSIELTAFEVVDILNNLYKARKFENYFSSTTKYIEHVINIIEGNVEQYENRN